MKKEVRSAVYDQTLRVEAYRFEGIAQPFPSHFHEYYVFGLMEKRGRLLSCGDQDCLIRTGDVLLFNPKESHGCIQEDGNVLDYRCFNIECKVILDLVKEASGRSEFPRFF